MRKTGNSILEQILDRYREGSGRAGGSGTVEDMKATEELIRKLRSSAEAATEPEKDFSEERYQCLFGTGLLKNKGWGVGEAVYIEWGKTPCYLVIRYDGGMAAASWILYRSELSVGDVVALAHKEGVTFNELLEAAEEKEADTGKLPPAEKTLTQNTTLSYTSEAGKGIKDFEWKTSGPASSPIKEKQIQYKAGTGSWSFKGWLISFLKKLGVACLIFAGLILFFYIMGSCVREMGKPKARPTEFPNIVIYPNDISIPDLKIPEITPIGKTVVMQLDGPELNSSLSENEAEEEMSVEPSAGPEAEPSAEPSAGPEAEQDAEPSAEAPGATGSENREASDGEQ